MSATTRRQSRTWKAIIDASDPVEEHPQFPPFQHVIKTVDSKALAQYASETRRRLDLRLLSSPETETHVSKVAQVPIFGSKNVIYALEFKDGMRWCFKIPGMWHPNQWTAHQAATLDAEVLVMTSVREKTTIPVPRVFAHCNARNVDSPIAVPFILMAWLNGHHLDPSWFDGGLASKSDQDPLQTERTIVNLAGYMNQFSRFLFRVGGWLTQETKESRIKIGGYYLENELHKVFPWHPRSGYYSPCPDYRTFFLRQLKTWSHSNERRERSDYKFAEFLCQHVPNATALGQTDFVLCHPNLDWSSILVRNNGNIAAILDWSGACVMPRLIGYEAYPRWLALDWINQSPNCGDEDELREYLPEIRDLRFSWRSTVQGRNYTVSTTGSPQDATRQSLFFGRLWEALRSSEHRHDILFALYSRILAEIKMDSDSGLSYEEQMESLHLEENQDGIGKVLEAGLSSLLSSHYSLA